MSRRPASPGPIHYSMPGARCHDISTLVLYGISAPILLGSAQRARCPGVGRRGQRRPRGRIMGGASSTRQFGLESTE